MAGPLSRQAGSELGQRWGGDILSGGARMGEWRAQRPGQSLAEGRGGDTDLKFSLESWERAGGAGAQQWGPTKETERPEMETGRGQAAQEHAHVSEFLCARTAPLSGPERVN